MISDVVAAITLPFLHQRACDSPDILVPEQQPPSQHQQNKGNYCRLEEEKERLITINVTMMETVNRSRFIRVHFCKDPTWINNTDTSTKTATLHQLNAEINCHSATRALKRPTTTTIVSVLLFRLKCLFYLPQIDHGEDV